MCIRIYIFNFKTKQKKQTNKETKTTTIIRKQKAKETKEEKRISVKNLLEYDDIVCEYALRTFNLFDRDMDFSWWFI